jgi:putative transcriptional regulator
MDAEDIAAMQKVLSLDQIEAVAEAMQDIMRYERGEIELKVTKIIPLPIDVIGMREALGLSQIEFSDRFGIPLRILLNWEEGKSQPEGPAELLMQLIEQDPDYVEREYAEYRSEKSVQEHIAKSVCHSSS